MNDLKVTAVQVELAWEDEAHNLGLIEDLLSSLNEDTDLIVLPETFTSGFSMQPQRFAKDLHEERGVLLWMKDISSRFDAVVTGSVAVEENGSYYNRLLWVDGDRVLHYNKKHLFSFAGEHLEYSSGNEVITPEIKGWKIRPLICYDLRFPVWSKNHWQHDGPEYDALIYVANWPDARVHVWRKLLMARAIENQVYAVGVNRIGTDLNDISYSGNTMMIDPYGMPLVDMEGIRGLHTETFSHELLTQFRAKFPVLKDGN